MRRGAMVSCILGVVAIGCGGSDATTDDPAGADGPTGVVEVSVDRLCDPVEGDVAAWAGGTITAEHNPIYAESDEPSLVCTWNVDGTDRSIRVDYVAVPDSFFLNLVEGRQDRSDLPAPNFHDVSSFYVIAPNGWGIVVSNRGTDRSEDLEPMAVIARAAVDLLPAG